MVKKQNFLLCIFLTIITLGLYGLYWLMQITDNVNELAKPEKKTTGFKSLLFVLITCGIYLFFWSWEIGVLMSQARSKTGLPDKNLKPQFLIWTFFAWPVSMALMQKEINELSSEPEHNVSFYDVQQNAGNRIIGWGISIAGTLAAFLFLLFSLILKLGFAPGRNMGRGQLGYHMALWMYDTFKSNSLPFSLIFTGICILIISSLCLKPCYGGKKSRTAGIIVITAMILLSVSLFINGANYNAFYCVFPFSRSSLACNILMMSSMLVAGIGVAVFCCMEFMISLSINKLRSVFLAAAAVLLGIVTVLFTITSVLGMLDHSSYKVLGYLFLFGVPFLLLALAQLFGCIKVIKK